MTSPRTMLRLCAAASCAAMLFAGVTAAQARPMGHMPGAHPFMGHGHWQHPSHSHFRGAHRRFRHQPTFGLGYGQTPYLSGTFPSGPVEEGGPIPDEYPTTYYEPQSQPCVVPLLIELKHRPPPRHMPRITYGSPSFCPPPFVAEAY